MKKSFGRQALGVLLVASVAAGCSDDSNEGGATDPNDLALLNQVLETNADIAFAAYSDSVDTAQALRTAIDSLVAEPSAQTLADAREAWRVAREPYGQTEVYRFRASPIDDTNYDPSDGEDGPEGDINAWPLGEALIDYVKQGTDFGADQIGVTENGVGIPSEEIPPESIINNPDIEIDGDLLANTATAEDERDVIAGYHAIEFLLWGQDLNEDGSADTVESRDSTPGQRPHTDFLSDGCTSGDTVNPDSTTCDRRVAYLGVAIDKLIADLTSVRDEWEEGAGYRTAFTTAPDLATAKQKLLEILTGMGTLSEGELAGERMQIALSANSQEDEHSCFADNTHRDIALNAGGIENSYFGDYPGYDGSLDGLANVTTNAVEGYGIDDYLRDIGFESLAEDMETALSATQTGYQAIDADARAGMPVDNVILDATSDDAQPMRDTIVALNAQSVVISRIAEDLDVGSADDVVDPGGTECDTTDPTTEC